MLGNLGIRREMALGIKMFAVDLDGTLLDSNRSLSEANVLALQRLASSGVIVVLASGRALCTMTPFAAKIGLSAPVVSCNGAYAVDAGGGEIFHHSLGGEAVRAIIDHAEVDDTYVNVYSRLEVYASHGGPWLELYRKRTGAEPVLMNHDELRAVPANKILFVDEPSRIPHHLKSTEGLAKSLGFEITLSERDYIEFLPFGISKQVGVKAVADYLGFEAAEVAAIGDWHNDLEMIRWAGLGAAVANATPQVLAAAKVTVSSNIENGVAEFIDQYLLIGS